MCPLPEGQPPEIALDPKYLADAIEIGQTLRLVDKLNLGMATGPSGNFCVLMSQRFPPKGQQTVRYYGTYSNKTRSSPQLRSNPPATCASSGVTSS